LESTAIIFLHGFASSSQSTKAKYLQEKTEALSGIYFHALDLNPTQTDFRYLTTTGTINRLRQYILDQQLGTVRLIGSSFGGLVAIYYAHRFGDVDKMLLLAPLLQWELDWLSEEEIEQWQERGIIDIAHYGFGAKITLDYGFYVNGQRYRDSVPPPELCRSSTGKMTTSFRCQEAGPMQTSTPTR
jgi:pimeloyl-ACP methyl ester carboxylesterase